MKLLVCISKTPDTTAKIAFKDGGTKFDESGVQYILNPYDEWYALVRALELKEQHGGSVTVINVGDPSNDVVIRKALAIGADDAARVNTEATDAGVVAANIANYAKENGYDIVFTGKETIDFNSSEVGPMIAEHMGLPYISYASHMDHDGTKAVISRDIEGGIEVVEVTGSFVISASKGMAEQRIPNMRGIMMAKRKPLNIVEPISVASKVRVVSYKLPDAKSGVKMIDPENMDELVRLLHEEAKVF
ncbi:MAG: electron transfer flavoprotein beta subunit [Saprospiraceae bacterium]|jgi:electron transfer flavoprotein beta subunit